LRCYDEIVPPSFENKLEEYEQLSVNDVYLDWRQLMGHKVSVRGRIQDLVADYTLRDVDGGEWCLLTSRVLLAPSEQQLR